MENQSSKPEINGKDFCCCKAPSEAEKVAKELRDLMKDKVGDEKCALCKAASELEKTAGNPSGGLDWAWPFLMMMLLFPFGSSGNNPSVSETAMKAYFETMEKERKAKDGSKKQDFYFQTVDDSHKEAH